jgi:hypothetical protein
MTTQINTSPISNFIQQVKSAELSQSKEVKISIQQARLLVLTLTEVLENNNRNWEEIYTVLKNSKSDDVITVNLDGGGFGPGR